MTISGNVSDGDWSVAATTHRTAGGFNFSIQFSHHTLDGIFKHEFMQSNVFPTEREAVLGGLREGMEWVRLKMANTFSIQPRELSVGPE